MAATAQGVCACVRLGEYYLTALKVEVSTSKMKIRAQRWSMGLKDEVSRSKMKSRAQRWNLALKDEISRQRRQTSLKGTLILWWKGRRLRQSRHSPTSPWKWAKMLPFVQFYKAGWSSNGSNGARNKRSLFLHLNIRRTLGSGIDST